VRNRDLPYEIAKVDSHWGKAAAMKRTGWGLFVLLVLAGIAYFVHGLAGRPTRVINADNKGALRDRALADTESGKRIVVAIYDFRNHWGLWPSSLRELIPKFISTEVLKGWHFNSRPSGWWQLTRHIDFPDWAVVYERRKDYEGWQLTDGEVGSELEVAQPKPADNTISEKQLLKNFQLLMKQRIEAEPERMIHYQGEISWYYGRKQFEEARKTCLRCLGLWPDHWWPVVMLSMVDAQLGSFKEAEQRLIQFTSEKKEFNYSFLLATFYFSQGQPEKAFATLKTAAQLPIRSIQDELYSRDQPKRMLSFMGPWRAAVEAYQAKRFDIALAVCDHWEQFRIEKDPSADCSFYTIRAACFLSQGQFYQARAQVSQMIRAKMNGRYLEDNVEDLANAIERRDASFVYQSQDYEPFSLLIEYE
jgi:tetratricopeptide (TPR) repeat protein